jgi:hypothetical protein
MSKPLKQFAVTAAVLSFSFCLAGGVFILATTPFEKDAAWLTGMGFYFVGKAIFVAALLVISAFRA